MRTQYFMYPLVGNPLKTKDIEKLTLKDLSKTGSKSIKALFFGHVKHLGGTNSNQVEIALAQMDSHLFTSSISARSP